ncbi:DUF5063 domain-containing protein [Nocardioides aurantiacus]|uniref:DUF5063 domain-containing protein n=1 Tax=Nocardioides aurantiacus TaxID=86796 RepID=UPI003CCC614F
MLRSLPRSCIGGSRTTWLTSGADLRGGLQILASGAPMADVVWEWRFTFKSHWGVHAIEAIRALHAARHD